MQATTPQRPSRARRASTSPTGGDAHVLCRGCVRRLVRVPLDPERASGPNPHLKNMRYSTRRVRAVPRPRGACSMPTPETEVLAANQAFYDAFSQHDITAMEGVWSQRTDLACVHPGWDAILGRREVLSSWRAILSSPEAPVVECVQVVAHVVGDFAYVV